jgi:hypothetical protein
MVSHRSCPWLNPNESIGHVEPKNRFHMKALLSEQLLADWPALSDPGWQGYSMICETNYFFKLKKSICGGGFHRFFKWAVE